MFYVIEIVSTKDGTAKTITEKPTQDEAVMMLHQVFSSAMANANANSCICMVIDDTGSVLRDEYWARS